MMQMLEPFQTEWCPAIPALDAERMLSIVDNDHLAPIAADVKRRLGDVVARACCTNGRR